MNQSDSQPQAQEQPEATPFACDMLALTAEERPRHAAVTAQLREAIMEVKDLPDGYGFRFAASAPNILLLSEFITRERLCCPFFTFEMVAEGDGGPLWLSLLGRAGVKDFIKAELNIQPERISRQR